MVNKMETQVDEDGFVVINGNLDRSEFRNDIHELSIVPVVIPVEEVAQEKIKVPHDIIYLIKDILKDNEIDW